MKEFAKLLEAILDRFEQLVRYALPGIVALILGEWLLYGRNPFELTKSAVDNPWALLFPGIKVVALGVVIYSVHRYIVWGSIQWVAALVDYGPVRTTGEGGYPQALGRFLRQRFSPIWLESSLSKHLFIRWAFLHLATMTGEIGLVLSLYCLASAVMRFSCTCATTNVVTILIIREAFGLIAVAGFWHLLLMYEAEAEIW